MSDDNDDKVLKKRNKRPHNSISKKRITNKMRRQAGMEYVGFSMKNNKMKQDTTRMARKMGSPCTSHFCKKSKLRHCSKFNEDARTTIFKSFWKELKSWDGRQMFVQSLVKRMPQKNPVAPNASNRPFQFFFFWMVTKSK